jgi:hypothetical protein
MKEPNKVRFLKEDSSNILGGTNEHPSVDKRGRGGNAISNKYAKYIKKRRSASRGVFGYNEQGEGKQDEDGVRKVKHVRTKTMGEKRPDLIKVKPVRKCRKDGGKRKHRKCYQFENQEQEVGNGVYPSNCASQSKQVVGIGWELRDLLLYDV